MKVNRTMKAIEYDNIIKNKGKIQNGYDADIVIFNEDLNIKKVIINGRVK